VPKGRSARVYSEPVESEQARPRYHREDDRSSLTPVGILAGYGMLARVARGEPGWRRRFARGLAFVFLAPFAIGVIAYIVVLLRSL
jgi:hypothetical protein